MANKPISEEILAALALKLKVLIPTLCDVLLDWPEPNETLKYPSISLITGAPTIRPQQAHLVSSTSPSSIHKIKTIYCVGEYEWNIQLDLWCASKKERHAYTQLIFDAFASQFPIMGLSLPLANYHSEIARYDLTTYRFDDSEAGSQRKEWRTKINVIANCEQRVAKDEFAMVTPQLDLTISQGEIIIE